MRLFILRHRPIFEKKDGAGDFSACLVGGQEGARPRLRLGPCSLSVYTVVGSGKILYVKFLSTISVTFFEGKNRGGAGESDLSCLARWRPTTRKS